MDNLEAFIALANLFESHHHKLYLVGGTVRDYLLNLPLSDMDAVSDATPEEIISFLPNVDTTFMRMGSLKYKDDNNIKFDITTLREEKGYADMRHPNEVIFVKDLEKDYLRRDFTINALYMDKDLKIYDFCHGQDDLKNKIIKVVGNADKRLKEDPLRILRAVRFSLIFDFELEASLYQAMVDNFPLLTQLTDAKIKSEIAKIPFDKVNQKRKDALFMKFDIDNLKGVIK